LGVDVKPFRIGGRAVAVLALACLLLISAVGYLYLSEVSEVREDMVGVVAVTGPIISSSNASMYTGIINQALLNESVKAVVLSVDSPGGSAQYIEQVYLDLLQLKEKKPVVASVVSALSGGYYMSVAADYIYVHPTSTVGNIGVIGVGPPTLIPSERVLETGAYKVTGFSKLLFPFNLTHALDGFVSAVEAGRGGRLKLSSTELRRGKVYMGGEAVKAGLADEIGSLQKAVGKAAMEAGLERYGVMDLNRMIETRGLSLGSYNQTAVEWRDLTVETLNRLHPPPAVYYLYLPPDRFTQGIPRTGTWAGMAAPNITAAMRRGGVLVDNTHGNMVSVVELDTLIGELAKRNVTVSFVSKWDELRPALANASCLIVASPTQAYSTEEVRSIEDFVDDGKLLLLFFDPASEYVEVSALSAPINSVSTRFGLSFAMGYLYNEDDHYGFYRNIYVRSFADSNITLGLSSLVLFTATHIYSNEGVAWTSVDTCSSTAERTGSYTTITWAVDNGSVAAFGDVTFLAEPYCYLEDNYRLILNLADAIAAVRVRTEDKEAEAPVDEVVEAVFPVGTEKTYIEELNGKEQAVRWVKVSETVVRIERPNLTSNYYYDEEGSLLRWESDGMEAIYDAPLPKEPYPLTKGDRWSYESKYTLTIGGEKLPGSVVGQEEVTGFEEVEAGNGKSYFCAKVTYKVGEEITRNETKINILSAGQLWISSDAGVVMEESFTRTLIDETLVNEETRKLLLMSVRIS